MKKQLIIALVAVSCSMSLQAVGSLTLSQRNLTQIWAKLHFAKHCIKPADLISSNRAFNDTITINGLTMTIESTRVIGDKVMLSGKFVSNSQMELRSLGDLTAITPSGTKLTTTDGIWAGVETGYLNQVYQKMQTDIPVSFDILFDSNGEKINEIKLFTVNLYEPGNTNYVFRNILIPSHIDSNISASCIEIYKNVYLKFTKQSDTEGHLKIYFSVENKSGKERPLFFENLSLVDDSGNAFNDCNIYIYGKKQVANGQNMFPDIPISGCFDFTGNIPFSKVKLLNFSTHFYANFAIKQIVFEP